MVNIQKLIEEAKEKVIGEIKHLRKYFRILILLSIP